MIHNNLAVYAAKSLVEWLFSYKRFLDSELQDKFEDMAWVQCKRDWNLIVTIGAKIKIVFGFLITSIAMRWFSKLGLLLLVIV